MKIIENCFDQVYAFECQYGAHLFYDDVADIYVSHWLWVSNDLFSYFSRKNKEGCVGHCRLVFRGVERFNFTVMTHGENNNKIILNEPVSFSYMGAPNKLAREFFLEGSLQGFPSSVTIKIEAEKFELHILDKDEPAREG